MSDNNAGFTPPPAPPVGFSTPGSNPSNPIYVTQGRSDKSLLIATVLAGVFFFTGLGGLHRFYIGKIGTGLLMLFTLGGLGIWALIDLIVLITGNFRDRDNNRITNWSTSN
jgi:TM2 domain-containing membrane protein YozV